MRQATLASVGFERFGKTTRRAAFLAEMNQIVPWKELCQLIEPVYPKPGNGRRPVGLERMLRIYFLQQWFNLSDPAVEEALYESLSMRGFAGIDLGREPVPEPMTGASAVRAQQRAIPQAPGTQVARKIDPSKLAVAEAPEPPVLEDWWLVRDSQGHTGWLFGRMVDVDAPDTLTRYSEGQKFVGAYVLTTVHDEGAPTDLKDIPVYVTVMNSYKSGLPYDFDQVRVFTWSLQHHRYETAFREKNIEGYLPVIVTK